MVGQQLLVALGAELVLRAEVVHHEAGAHPGVGRDGTDRRTETLHREPEDRGVADPGACGQVGAARAPLPDGGVVPAAPRTLG